ncbi:MAG: type I DNA topoisomerase [Candidatus Omnitrophota bacterium]
MAKYLVIVESPTKARTITSILGSEYEVTSSMGHLVDLPSRSISIDIEGGFVPSYNIIPGKKKTVSMLKKKVKGKEGVYLATDPDREGEAISWHIKNILERDKIKFWRVVFHEITESAIKEAFSRAGELNLDKVNAQKVRRVLDRIVGYYLSPLLWKKIVRGLSAGRVQSVALNFIVEREKEIKQFVPTITYELEAFFRKDNTLFPAKLKEFDQKKAVFIKKEEADDVLKALEKECFFVKDINKRQFRRKPPPPFTTSLLQQEAFNKLRFSSKKTMLVAQKLYEGVEINNEMSGLITYMRTDSFRVSDKAKDEVKNLIKERFGENYMVEKDYKHKDKKSAQGAHEAIRPTLSSRDPAAVKDYLSPDELKLYELIWRRFVASFMKEAVLEASKVTIGNQRADFVAEERKVVFDGFLSVLGREQERLLPPMAGGEEVILDKIAVVEKTTKAAPRFTDASLVKLLEEKGIGRPSTYAPIISTLIMRNYIRREKGSFVPTDLAFKVCDLLVEHFPDIMDENFTAQIEERLDAVEDGLIDGKNILDEFYPPFKKEVEEATQLIKKHVELIDKICPKCGRQLMIKWSKRGRFLSCSDFPQCKYAESITSGVSCPDCKEGELIERRNKRGQFFYGCSRFPQCRYTSRFLPKQAADSSGQKEQPKQ